MIFAKMAKDKKLTDHERGQTEAFSLTGISNHTIATKTGRYKSSKYYFN